MIRINGHEIVTIIHRKRFERRKYLSEIKATWIENGEMKARTVWQAVRSCFGSGMWVNAKPWLNDEGWKL